MNPLNVIIVCVDQMRADCLAAMGRNADIRTPNLDRFAARSTMMRQHFTTFPKCVPARISMMTGRYAHTDGYRTITQFMPAGTPDLASTLQSRGYELVELGLNHCWENMFDASHTPPRLKEGQKGIRFDHHAWTAPLSTIWNKHAAASKDIAPWEPATPELGQGYISRGPRWQDVAVVEQARSYLSSVRDKSKPFFLQVNLGTTHTPYRIDEPFYSMYDRTKLTLYPGDLPKNAPISLTHQHDVRGGARLTEFVRRELQAIYFGMASQADAFAGQVLAEIEQQGLLENSVVIFTSDHGDFAGQYGLVEKWDTTFSDCLTHVPLLISAPGVKAGASSDALSDHSDFAPTIVDLLGLDPLPGAHGASFAGILQGRSAQHRTAVFADGGHEAEMRTRFASKPAEEIPPPKSGNEYTGVSKQITYRQFPDTMARARMIRTATHKLVVRETADHELYDLRVDAWELNNVYTSVDHSSVKLDLQEQLLRWCLLTDTDRPYQAKFGA
jgi:arylsulfatase A-like enzyme